MHEHVEQSPFILTKVNEARIKKGEDFINLKLKKGLG